MDAILVAATSATGRVALDTVVRGLNGDAVPRTIYVPSPAMTAQNLGALPADHWAPENWSPN